MLRDALGTLHADGDWTCVGSVTGKCSIHCPLAQVSGNLAFSLKPVLQVFPLPSQKTSFRRVLGRTLFNFIQSLPPLLPPPFIQGFWNVITHLDCISSIYICLSVARPSPSLGVDWRRIKAVGFGRLHGGWKLFNPRYFTPKLGLVHFPMVTHFLGLDYRVWSPTSGGQNRNLRKNCEWTYALVDHRHDSPFVLGWNVMLFTGVAIYVLESLILFWCIHMNRSLWNMYTMLSRISFAHIPQDDKGVLSVVTHSWSKGHPRASNLSFTTGIKLEIPPFSRLSTSYEEDAIWWASN